VIRCVQRRGQASQAGRRTSERARRNATSRVAVAGVLADLQNAYSPL
jgi:hypothetical protein